MDPADMYLASALNINVSWVASSETPIDSRQSKVSVHSSVGFRLRNFFSLYITAACG